ncbi:MAG TPA: ATP-binding protein [Dehalococcoidales bacterium]|nr:ATP-binding protein [Dehalococcoidales bacterium]
MEIEEHFMEALDEIEVEETAGASRSERSHQRYGAKNKFSTDRFLGQGKRVSNVGIVPRYYGELLTWALQRYLEKEGWQVVQVLGYHGHEPVYIDVNTDVEQYENLLRDGQMLVEKDASRLIITVDINLRWRNSILVEGLAKDEIDTDGFVHGVITLAKELNLYRGKKIELAGRLRFLNLKNRSMESIILDDITKKEIRANTTGFLNKKALWKKYGISSRRGLLLAGEPGTGKTIICKSLMAEATGLTCIITSAYYIDSDEYLTELYELAAELSPSLVFIEDIDLIGQNREEFGYQRGKALLSLLAVLDGIEEKKEIVTVATTNSIEILDKALSQRPSRFDRVIKLSRPGYALRRALVGRLCQIIPCDERLQEYIAHKTEGYTPAQVQEVIHSLVIENSSGESAPDNFSELDVDYILSRINVRNCQKIGFSISNNHQGNQP